MRIDRILLAIVGLVMLTLCVNAQTNTTESSPNPASASTRGYSYTALADGYFNYSFNHPATGWTSYRNFDARANQPALNMLRLGLDKEAGPLGFHVDFGYGRAMDLLHFADTANGFTKMNYLPQAYVSYRPLKTTALQIDFGKFYTSAGAELTETNVNWNYSRSLLYALGPYYHFGLRVNMPWNPKLTTGFQIVNGWNNVKDNNGGKTMGLTSTLNLGKFAWSNNYYGGPEKTDTNEGIRHFFDSVLTWNPNARLSAYLNVDIGRENLARGLGSQNWQAAAMALRWQIDKKWAFSPRAEFFNDADGFASGTAQQLKEFTLTGEYKLHPSLISRLEYRKDWSNRRVFERGGTPNAGAQQNTVLLGLVATFSGKR